MTEAIAGRYEVTHALARAGCVEVHAADDRWLRRSVAVALCPARACSPTDRAQFKSTGRVLGRLAHPNLADTYDLGRHDDSLFVVFERPGSELASALAEGAWDQERVARLASELTAGVDALHRAGACHGGIHPGCVGLRPDGTVRLTPWPVADPPPGWGGPRGWLAPERISGDAASVRADLWSAAAVLLSALIGAGPGSLDEEELAELTGQLRRSADPALLAAVSTALRREPTDRYASATEMEAALVAAREGPARTGAAGVLVGAGAPVAGRAAPAHPPVAPLIPPPIRLRRLHVPRPPLGRWGWRGAAVGLAALCIPIAALETEAAPPAPASCIKGSASAACSASGPAQHHSRHSPRSHRPAGAVPGAEEPDQAMQAEVAAAAASPAVPVPPVAGAAAHDAAPPPHPAPPPHRAPAGAPPAGPAPAPAPASPPAPAHPAFGGPGAPAGQGAGGQSGNDGNAPRFGDGQGANSANRWDGGQSRSDGGGGDGTPQAQQYRP